MNRRAAITVRDVWRALDDRFPFAHRADWDNVGILVGDPRAPVRSVVIALDATPAVLSACRRVRSGLLVTHHPVIFSPLKSLSPRAIDSGPAAALVRMGVAAISAHTNADVAHHGVSHALARRIGLGSIRPLLPGEPSCAFKLAVFVPPGSADAVLSAIAGAGGGRIGAYSRCSFSTPGTGTYLPAAQARPFRGKAGREERVEEVRLESVVPESLLPAVLSAVRAAHPYEEPAIDVVQLKAGALGGGVGAVGDLPAPVPLDAALATVHRRVRPSFIKVAGRIKGPVRRVAVVAGSGADFTGAARAAGADLFVTGDLKYHQALEAAASGMPVADIGHGAGEKWILPEFRRAIEARFGKALSVRVVEEEEPQRLFRPGRTSGGRIR